MEFCSVTMALVSPSWASDFSLFGQRKVTKRKPTRMPPFSCASPAFGCDARGGITGVTRSKLVVHGLVFGPATSTPASNAEKQGSEAQTV